MDNSIRHENNRTTLRDLFSIKWYIEQSSGWSFVSYALIIIAAVGNLYISFGMGQPITWVTFATYIASVLSIWCIGGIANSSPVNGVGGFLSATIYIAVALAAKNPADGLTQLIYMLVLDLPVLILPSWSQNVDKKIRFIHETKTRGEKHGPAFWYSFLAILAVVAFVASYSIEVYVLKTPRPIADSLVLASGLVGAVLTTFRFSESTICWFIQGVLQVTLWGLTALHGDANWVLFFTYSLFLVNDVYMIGFSKWVHHSAETQAIVEANKKIM